MSASSSVDLERLYEVSLPNEEEIAMKFTRLGWVTILCILGLAGGGYYLLKKNQSHTPAPPPFPSSCKGLLGRPLRVGVVTWPGYAGGIVANNGFKPNEDSIFYKQHNLCVELLLM